VTNQSYCPLIRPHIDHGLDFFNQVMLGPLLAKLRYYRRYNVRPTTMSLPSDWEVLTAILCDVMGSGHASGMDLTGYEVKSAISGAAYEYQFHRSGSSAPLKLRHRESGRALLDSMEYAGHLFWAHRDLLTHVELWYVNGQDLRSTFERWKREFPPDLDPNRRFRRSVTHTMVQCAGIKLLTIQDGEEVLD